MDGRRRMGSFLRTLILLTAGMSGVAAGCDSMEPSALLGPDGESLVEDLDVFPKTSTLTSPQATLQLQARGLRGNSSAAVVWWSSDSAAVRVDQSGLAIALGEGSATIYASYGKVRDSTKIEVRLRPKGRPPVAVPSSGELIGYPSSEVASLVGPQLRSGSEANPWPFFDRNAHEHGLKLFAAHGAGTDTYYDFALNQYIQYYRSGDTRHLDAARTSADAWYANRSPAGTSTPPRSQALGGIMLRALDGRAEYWPWLEQIARHHYGTWIGRRLDRTTPYYGLRDGAYALLYIAQLAQVHPDLTVRAELSGLAAQGASWFAGLQAGDGGWYWDDPDREGWKLWSQPFHVGLLLEALVASHQLSGDAAVARAITRGVDWLWEWGYSHELTVPSRPDSKWRGFWYFVYPPDSTGTRPAPNGITDLASGWDTNTIREVRQRGCTAVHAWGYAYRLTGDAKYRTQGDEVFAALFGKGEGPLADPFYSLADYRAKEYNQCYRSSGRYLAWRSAIQ